MSLPSFAVRRRVTTGVIFIAIAVFGVVALSRLGLDVFPDVEIPAITVITAYPGASATDVDDKVTDTIEEALSASPGLREMSSFSRENVSVVVLQYEWGTDLDESMNDIRARVDLASRDLPEVSERPVLMRFNLARLPVVMLGVTSDRSDIQEHAELIERRVASRIERLDGVASVTPVNQRSRQVVVVVDRQRLESYGLSLERVAGILQMENLSLPAGSVDIGRTSYILRVPGELSTLDEVGGVILSQGEGGLVRLRDVAEVREELEEAEAVATINGRDAVLLLVHKESGANVVDVARGVKSLLVDLDIPEHLQVTVLSDGSEFIEYMVGHLTRVITTGGFIVIVVVFLFLRRFRTTLIVALTIPTCLIAVFAMLWARGYTLNSITLASLAISIGIVVDNTIVVVENIVRHQERGGDLKNAAVRGAEEVSGAVFASSLTNVAIFAPIVFVTGIFGIFFGQLAFVVTVAVVLSLLVALMLGPMLSSLLIRARDVASGGVIWRALAKPMDLLEAAYGRLIESVIRSRRGIVAVIVLTLVAFVGSLGIGLSLGQDYIPKPDQGALMVRVELPTGTSIDRTARVAQQVEALIKRRVPEALMTYVQAGSSERGLSLGGAAGSNVALVGCRLPRLAERDRTAIEIAEDLRPEVSKLPGLVSSDVGQGTAMGATPGFSSTPLVVELFTDDPEAGRDAAIRVRDLISATPGISDVSTDLLAWTPELSVHVDRDRASQLGVPMAKVASAIHLGVHGHDVTRFRGGDEDMELVLRLNEEDRRSIDTIRLQTVPSLTGGQVRLDNIAEITEAQSPVELRRLDGSRLVRVMAGVSGRALSEVAADIEAGITVARDRGEISRDVEMRLRGDVEDQRSMVADLSLAVLMAILLVYLVMAAQFESLLDPLVIMFSVPFGISGVFLALLVTGTTLQLSSFMGVIIIVGIVVNNAIVLIDYINEMRRQGMTLREAVAKGSARRLRPVMMTTLTTIAGMLPLAAASGEGSEIWQPMGIAVIGGLSVSMLVTLVLVPSVYVATDRFRTKAKTKDSIA